MTQAELEAGKQHKTLALGAEYKDKDVTIEIPPKEHKGSRGITLEKAPLKIPSGSQMYIRRSYIRILHLEILCVKLIQRSN